MDHSKLLDEIRIELRALVAEYEGDTRIERRLEQNAKLAEAVHRHGRVMRFALGEKIEPEAHHGEGVLIGTMGGLS